MQQQQSNNVNGNNNGDEPALILQLQSEINQLKLQLNEATNREVEASNVVLQWENHCNVLEKEHEDTVKQLECEAREYISGWEAKCIQLQEELRDMQEERDILLQEKSDNAAAAEEEDEKKAKKVVDSMDTTTLTTAKEEEYQKQIQQLQSELQSKNDEVEELNTKLNMIEKDTYNHLSELQSEEETKNKIQNEYYILEKEKNQIEKIVQDQKSELQLKEQIVQDQKTKIKDAEKSINELQNKLQTNIGKHDQFRNKYKKLKDDNDELTNEYAKLQEEAENVISQWSHRCTSLEDESLSLEKDMEKLRLVLQDEIIKKVEMEEKLNVEICKRKSLEASVEEKQNHNKQLDSQNKSLQEHILLLNNELDETYVTLQNNVTNILTDKATNVTTDTLRNKLNETNKKLTKTKTILTKERNERLKAEQTIKELKDDLSSVLLLSTGGGGGNNNDGNNLKSLTYKATRELQRRERSDIKNLNEALQRSIRELNTSKSKQSISESQAASAWTQLSTFEREVISSKSDIQFLKSTIDEMRHAEANKVCALQHHIDILEEDRETMSKLHVDEQQTIRNELNQIIQEKDSLILELQKKDKLNSSLMQHIAVASSPEKKASQTAEGGGGGQSSDSKKDYSTTSTSNDNIKLLQDEMAMLRIENKKLLNDAEEYSMQIENQKRLQIELEPGAQTSEQQIINKSATISSKTDVIEKEDKVEDETTTTTTNDTATTIDNLKSEIIRLQNIIQEQEEEIKSGRADTTDSETLLKQFVDETNILSCENDRLKIELENLEKESNQIKDKYHKIQSKKHISQRKELLQADILEEIIHLQRNETNHNQIQQQQENGYSRTTNITSSNDNNDDSDDNSNLDENNIAVEAYDCILRQKIAIDKERTMYNELNSDYEDLLSYLAQVNNEKSYLVTALEGLIDDNEVISSKNEIHLALKEAKCNTIKKFGMCYEKMKTTSRKEISSSRRSQSRR